MAVRKKRAKKKAPSAATRRASSQRACDIAALPDLAPRVLDDGTIVEPSPDDRVSYILELMAADVWVTGKTGPVLAEKWGKSKSTVEGYAARASSELRRLLKPDVDRIRAIAANTIARCGKKAEEKGEFRTAVDAAHKGASLFCPVTQKLEHSGPDGAPLNPAVIVLPEKDAEPPEDFDADG